MIYGDSPVKWNERNVNQNDPLGLNRYTSEPDIHAIMQSGNRYAYCKGNPIMFSDPSGLLWQGRIHNDVVDKIVELDQPPGMQSNKRVDFPQLPRGSRGRMRYGYVDLFNPITHEMWEVKRCTESIVLATSQLSLYTNGRMHAEQYSNINDWHSGSDFADFNFVAVHGVERYYVKYWSVPGTGIVYYDYWDITDWDSVKEVGKVIIGGVVFIISLLMGMPQLQPLPA